MSKDNQLGTNRELTDQAIVTVFRGLGEAAKLHPELDEGTRAVISIMAPFIGFGVSRTGHKFISDRLPALTKGFARFFDNDRNRVEEHVKATEDDPNCHEIMYRTFRAMMDAADPEVVPTLGYLAGWYSYRREKADSYFRRLGRLLCDLDQGDLEQLRGLIRGILPHEERLNSGPYRFKEAPLRVGQQSNVTVSREVVEVELPGRAVEDDTEFEEIGHFPAAWKLFQLLKREGLGSSIHGGGGPIGRTLASGDETITIDFVKAKGMLAIIDPQPGDSPASRGRASSAET